MQCNRGRAANSLFGTRLEIPYIDTYGSVLNLNSGGLVAFSGFLLQLKKFEYLSGKTVKWCYYHEYFILLIGSCIKN